MAGCFALIAFTFVTLTWGQDVTSFTSVFPSSTASVPVGTVINGTSTTFNPVFTIPASADEGANLLPNIEDPEAVNAQTACPGYKATHVQEDEHGLTAVLTLAGKPCNVYGNDIEVLNLKVEFQSANRLAINISPAHLGPSNTSHYILSEDLMPRPKPDETYSDIDLKFDWDDEPSFWFSVTRHSTGDTIFTTEDTTLVYEDQFIEFVTHLPEDYNLYGLGERIHGLRLNNNLNATIYAADVGDPIDRNLYGSHPFYLETRYFETDGHSNYKPNNTRKNDTSGGEGAEYESYSHGVYLRNFHGQEVLLRPESLTWRLLGGSIDLFFFDGPTPAEVTRQYQLSVTGLPAMQSYWTLGFHQCRWGYRNWTETREIVQTMRDFDIPMETIWLDIDYMDQYRDFTLDPVTFPPSGVKEFFDWLHSNDQHFVPIVDAAIYIPNPNNASDAYDTYTRGNESGSFLMNPDGSQYIGAVWPGYTVFPDLLSKNAFSWWIKEMVEWYKEVPYSGFWIDMNEVSSFCVGSCGSNNLTLNPAHPPFALPGEPGNRIYDYPEGFNLTNATEASSASSASESQAKETATATESPTSTSYLRTTPTPGERNVNHPPYVIDHVHGDLAVHAVSPNATHANGVLEYDVHNLYGHTLLNATYQGLLQVFPGKRPFIIGRSTAPGSGRWAGHWGGDNMSKWAYMYFSIPQALSFSLFGIPMFGVDTCGFNGNTAHELCTRWMSLSAFFPFYRNHNVLSALPQEPYRWSSVATASRAAMHIRYSLLPYMYTLLHRAHTRGDTVMRALSWEFPHEKALRGVDNCFLLGPAVYVVPVLEPGVNYTRAVFPGVKAGKGKGGEKWYSYHTQTPFPAQPDTNHTIPAPLTHIPVFLRGGYVIPTQEPGYTTSASRKNPWSLLVALDVLGAARGDLYVDDGESLQPESTLDVRFEARDGALEVTARGSYRDANALANVTVMGVEAGHGGRGGRKKGVEEVRFNGKPIARGTWEFSAEKQLLRVWALNNVTRDVGAWGRNWTLSWE